MPTLTLHADEGPLKGLSIPWPEDGTVGRDAGNALTLKDTGVSRRHARIHREGDAWLLVDLESRNGCLVNGAKVQQVRLSEGDRIQIGSTVLRCGFEAAGAEPAVTDVIRLQSLWVLGTLLALGASRLGSPPHKLTYYLYPVVGLAIAMGPPLAASGETWPMQGPFVPPENLPSVIRATDSAKPIPTIAEVDASISRIPGPPLGPS